MRGKRLFCWATCSVLFLSAAMQGYSEPMRVIDASDFGIHADGVSDDGPVIRRMLEVAGNTEGAARLVFPEGKTIRVTTADDRFVIDLDRADRMTIDGRGCLFLLSPEVRFLRLTNSRDVVVKNLNVDFGPLPFADGVVTAVNAKEGYIDVEPLDSERPLPVGEAGLHDDEQRFFGMLWYAGPYDVVSQHYWVKRMERVGAPGTVRVFAGDDFKKFGDIEPGEWRISLPVPGNALRFGGGACFDLFDNENVRIEDVELWSAPWFGFRVFRNSGDVTFRRVHIRPKPGSGRLTSTWRDGFHVKGNSATLLWEDCILKGMNDDAFNISTHWSKVKEVISPTEIVVLQSYPLNVMPWHVGETFAAADFDRKTLLGEAKILKVTGSTETREIKGKTAATPVTLLLDKPIEGLKVGAMVWEPAYVNPNTTLRGCRIEKSSRMRSPMTLEGCEVTALMWFYASEIEGPFPSGVTIRDCILRRGRGNPTMAVSFVGPGESDGERSAIHDVLLENNRIWGNFSMIGVDRAKLVGNEFLESGANVTIKNCEGVESVAKRVP